MSVPYFSSSGVLQSKSYLHNLEPGWIGLHFSSLNLSQHAVEDGFDSKSGVLTSSKELKCSMIATMQTIVRVLTNLISDINR